MSFLFKSSKKSTGPSSTALPPATREIRSSDCPNSQSSQIPTLNGVMNSSSSKPGSPTPHQQHGQGSVNTSLNSLAENGRSNSAPPQEQEMARQQAQYMRSQSQQDGAGASAGGMANGMGVGNGMGMRGAGPPSPEQKTLLRDGHTQQQRLPMQTRPAPSNTPSSADPSPYPWSQRRLTFTVSHTNPFPRYGAAVNATGSKDGSIYLMGGLINGSTVKGDLWMVEAGAAPSTQMTCYPVATTSEGPGPRVGHASLLVGNAFIVFGGDTKMDEGDSLDDTLYLLNTSTKQWSRALPAGPRPPGRYGHTLNILGSKIYIFGGQVEGYFFNDLVAFDLNALQQSTNRWEILIQNTIGGGPPHGQIPPARTNHTMISYNDRLYLFGGTDGVHWFNDVWSYSPHTNSWTQLECIGYIPSPREGHAASLVGDVMYIFGGRTEEGNDLGDLAAFRISSRRWYTFQNMGPSPSPRSGHSMTTVNKSIVVLAGEPSSAPRDPVELGLAYFLDTGKIRYPPDSASQTPVNERIQGTRRPSGDKSNLPAGSGQAVRGGPVQAVQQQNGPAELGDRERLRMGSGDSFGTSPAGTKRSESQNGSRLPRMATGGGAGGVTAQAPSPAPTGPPPQAPGQQAQQQRVNGVVNARQPTRPPERALSPSNEVSERAQRFEQNSLNAAGGRDSPAAQRMAAETRMPTSPGLAPPVETPYFDAEESANRDPLQQQGNAFEAGGAFQGGQVGGQQQKARQYQNPETYQPSQDQSQEALARTASRNRWEQERSRGGGREDMERIVDSDTPRQSVDDVPAPLPADAVEPEQLPKVRQLQQEDVGAGGGEGPQDSGIGSSPALSQQYDDLSKELEAVKAKNAWFASELALARKSGYSASRNTMSDRDSPTVLDERAREVFGDEDRPLIEALLKMRAELARVQEAIDEQSKNAAERIAEMQKQRDTAVNEAVFAKARLAGHADLGNGGARSTPDREREAEVNRKLATALNAQGELQRKIDGLAAEVEGERRARGLAEETAEAAQRRVQELEGHRQAQSGELERLRSELFEAQTSHRDLSASHAEISMQHKMLSLDKDEMAGHLERLRSEGENHSGVLTSLREAVQASTQKAELLERRLEEERVGRDDLEQRLRQLRSEHEDRTGELESTSRKLRDAEELAERHREEAATHRSAVLAGLGNIGTRDLGPSSASDERVASLQQQVESAHAMVRANQQAADIASQKLRSAEERIAGLEAYQEQASREGLGIRKQLQGVLKEKQGLESEKGELELRLQSQMLETNALAVQHSSLKDILGERGINASEVRKSRALDSPSSSLGNRFSTPDLQRVKELEQQLEASLKSHDEMKNQFEEVSERDEKMKREYEEKLTALDNDHQAAVKYLRGTEKMLSKMKQELQRVKNENGDLKKKMEKGGEGGGARGTPDAEWEQERANLRGEVEQAQRELKESVSQLEGRIEEMQRQLEGSHSELEQSRQAYASSRADLSDLQASHTQTRDDIEGLQKENEMLEGRARDAENKVQLLLDQVEHSVDNYRRQSRMADPSTAATMMNGNAFHQRNLSSGSSDTAADHIGGASTGGPRGHSRNISDAAESTYSIDAPSTSAGVGDDGRNSMALDSLASELETLRSHWETTNKNYRKSNDFDFERGGAGTSSGGVGGGGHAPSASGEFGSLASWRSRLDIGDEEDGSRPTTSEGTVRGEDEHRQGAGVL